MAYARNGPNPTAMESQGAALFERLRIAKLSRMIFNHVSHDLMLCLWAAGFQRAWVWSRGKGAPSSRMALEDSALWVKVPIYRPV